MEQPKETEYCGFFVCEYIYVLVTEKWNMRKDAELAKKRERLPLEHRFRAIGEELAGFYLSEALQEKGEYYDAESMKSLK